MTVAELKRRLVPGTKLTLVHTLLGPTRKERHVFETRSRDCVMYVPEKDANSYLQWPKASQLEATPRGFRIREDGEIAAEYEWGWSDDPPNPDSL